MSGADEGIQRVVPHMSNTSQIEIPNQVRIVYFSTDLIGLLVFNT